MMLVDDFETQRDQAYAVANAVSSEVRQEIHNWICHALETGDSYEEAKLKIDQLLNRHRLNLAPEAAS